MRYIKIHSTGHCAHYRTLRNLDLVFNILYQKFFLVIMILNSSHKLSNYFLKVNLPPLKTIILVSSKESKCLTWNCITLTVMPIFCCCHQFLLLSFSQ